MKKRKNDTVSSLAIVPTTNLDEKVIANRAYALWKEEGEPEGRDLAHWLRAEAELRAGAVSPASGVEASTAAKRN